MGLFHLLFAVAIVVPPCKAFLFDVKTDCLLSTWSEWIDIPGLAAPIRERSILRHDIKGGIQCPPSHDLREVKVLQRPLTTTPPSYVPDYHQQAIQQMQIINQTAHSISHNFLRRMNVQPVAGGNKETGHFRDLLIILDSSGSIGEVNYTRTKKSLSKLLKTLCPQPDPFGLHYHHAAMIVYSSIIKLEFNFGTFDNTMSVQNAIENAPYLDGTTCTTAAFDVAFNLLTAGNGMRPSTNIDKEVLILTDGNSNCGGDVFASAEKLRQKARVFALLIGEATEVGLDEMTSYVSSPIPDHLFALKDYKEFDSLIQLLEDQSIQTPCVPLDLPTQ